MKSNTSIILGIVALLCVGGVVSLAYYFSGRSHPTTSVTQVNVSATSTLRFAFFAGGCFWCTEADFEKVPGVLSATSGYTGGHTKNPSYDEVSTHTTGHIEAVRVEYDVTKVSYEDLLVYFWQHIDPTDPYGQFVDKGDSYRSAIFYGNELEHQLILKSKQKLENSQIFSKPIVTLVVPAAEFYVAEEYHQDYYKKNSYRYSYYRERSGRDAFLEANWTTEAWQKFVSLFKNVSATSTAYCATCFVKPSQAELKTKLTPLQYKVTQENGTERSFDNVYNTEKREGIYVDVVSGEPLYSSQDKYESGTGWPSFTKPLNETAVVLVPDNSFFSKRTEVKSALADSHLGHVFDDGPAPTGKRYCMNSAALRFVPKEDMEKEGYGDLLRSLGFI